MKRFLKFRHGEKGFTLLELLIVVAILGILAAVLVPNLAAFLGTGTVAAANTEAANVETAALAYYADNDGNWPANSDVLYDSTNPGNSYLSDTPKAIYTIGPDSYGKISSATLEGVPNPPGAWSGIHWDTSTEQWEKD